MQHQGQNRQIETLTKMALAGGAYSWNSVPISDSEAEDPRFYISQPQEPLRKAMLAAARRRDNELLAEPHVETKEYAGQGPRNPYTTPARVVPYDPRGTGPRGIAGTMTLETPEEIISPGPAGLKEVAGGGEGEKLLAQLDALSRKMLKRKKGSRDNNNKTRTAAEWEKERDRQVSSRVAGDRSPAMDVSAVLPFDSEVLQHWHKWLYSKITSQSVQRRNLDHLHEFLARVKGGRKFGELHWKDKQELAEIMRCMVEAEERDEASKVA